ncbi:hypothetical protein DFR75_112110 [Nocardia ignorata]|uniref:Uncharacterized protein n=1 Tax=Nocardia ignorata TaxID=145285 RepID=A0A4R6P3G0_NOCIG|nr:hypothetical protein DFR75_112110 [Nocardia ignorata]
MSEDQGKALNLGSRNLVDARLGAALHLIEKDGDDE